MLKKAVAVLLILAILPAEAFACTAIYIGSNLTADGSTIFARLEEFSSDEGWPKLFDVVPEGAHAAGEGYTGCYGFTWTFTHDSYGYTAFCDNNSQGICPDCEGTHAHMPYQAGGTNSKGVSVTATEVFDKFHTGTAMPKHTAEKPAEGLCYEMLDGTWGLYPDGWRDSWYWVFSMLEHIARADEAAAVEIRERMDALQDVICASGVIGDPAAEICWNTALDLLSEFGR